MPQLSLFDGFERGAPDRQEYDYNPPSSKFVSVQAIKGSERFAYKPGKIFLGVVDGEVLRDDRNQRYVQGGHEVGLMDDTHVCTVAGTRSGKGRAVIVPTMLEFSGSVLATDPKGELATLTAKRRKVGLGQRVFALDPFGVVGGYAKQHCRGGFNPVLAMRPNSLVADAALIADALVVTSDRDPHWDESARILIEGVTLHVRTWPGFRHDEPAKDLRSLVTVHALIARGGRDPDAARGYSITALINDMINNKDKEAGEAVQMAAADFWERGEKERNSVLSTARRHLKFIGLPGIQSVLKTHDFKLDDLKTGRTTVYLCLPARHIGTCRGWLRLFVNLALQSMEDTGELKPDQERVLFVLDEFAQLGKLSQIESASGQIASFGVKLWTILQDLGQLKAIYGDKWETFIANAGLLQFFGNNDLTTLEWISKRCGKTSIEVTRISSVTGEQSRRGAVGESRQMEQHELISLDEASRLFGRNDKQLRQLVIEAGQRPMVLQRAYYDKHKRFIGLVDTRP